MKLGGGDIKMIQNLNLKVAKKKVKANVTEKTLI